MTDINNLEKRAENIIGTALTHTFTAEQVNDLFFLMGGIETANAIATNLTSAVIRNLQRVRDEKLYAALGFTRFDDFLDEHPRAPMKYKRFNYLEGVVETLGAPHFDLLHGSGISMRTMKLLAAGDIEVEGNEVIVGGEERVPLGESRTLKAVVEQLVNDKRALANDLEKLETKNQKLADQVDQGQQDYDELQRAFDAQRQGDPHERLLTRTIANLLELTEVVGQMADARRAQVAADAMPVLWAAVQRVRKAYKINFVFTEPTESEESLLDSIAQEALAGGEDLD